MSRYFIGIEGGGTKTEGVLIDELGQVRVTLLSGPSNPWVVGFGNVASLIKTLIDELLAKAQLEWKDLVSVVSHIEQHARGRSERSNRRAWC